jgi:hypothetical protein
MSHSPPEDTNPRDDLDRTASARDRDRRRLIDDIAWLIVRSLRARPVDGPQPADGDLPREER